MHRKKISPLNPPFVDGKHNMTCLQLCESDDLATMMTVDAVLGFTTHKMDKNYNPALIDKKVRERWKEIMQEFIIDLNHEHTYNQLIATDKIKSNLKKDERFKRHIFRFLYLFDRRSGIKVSPCYRYENEGRKGAAIFATKEWEKGSQISTLFGCIAEMRPDEEEIFHESKNEFSVMYSTRKNCSQLWLGPAAYVNHDCKPNCRFTEGNDDSKMTLETLRDIHPGDELLIYYGNNFFGIDNAECECFTCELRDQGLFSRNFQNGTVPRMSLPDFGRPRTDNHNQLQPRHIATRSTKLILNGLNNDRARMSLSHTLNGVVDRLKKSDETYSLRVTYSRIDRVKKRIQSRAMNNNNNNNSTNTMDRSKSMSGAILKPKPRSQKPKPIVISSSSSPSLINGCRPPPKTLYNCHVPLVSLRRSARQSAMVVSPDSGNGTGTTTTTTTTTTAENSNHWGKLTIKLRKNVRDPNQYEQMLDSPSRPLSDCNIFSRITQLYLSQPDNGASSSTTSSRPGLQASTDAPPFLSPWFCSTDKMASSATTTATTAMSVTRPITAMTGAVTRRSRVKLRKMSSSASLAVVAPVTVSTASAAATGARTTTTDRPPPSSYSTSSPPIPVLEIESETEQHPSVPTTPPPPGLVREPPSSSSPNKGIVMKFSRISGNKFTSLLS